MIEYKYSDWSVVGKCCWSKLLLARCIQTHTCIHLVKSDTCMWRFFHTAKKRVLTTVPKGNYHVPKMVSTCAKTISSCALCQLLIANRNLAHRHFRAKLFITTRTSYAMDYIGVYKNKEGYCNILGIIDINLVLTAVKQKRYSIHCTSMAVWCNSPKRFSTSHTQTTPGYLFTRRWSHCAL